MSIYLRCAISVEPLECYGALTEVSADENGATNLFLGVTRNHHQDRPVKGLEYTCYEEMALKELERIAQEVADAHDINRMVVLHRIGEVPIGEVSLAVATGAHHRHQVLNGTLDFINKLKQDVPIWKREYFADGSVGWVEGAKIEPAS